MNFDMDLSLDELQLFARYCERSEKGPYTLGQGLSILVRRFLAAKRKENSLSDRPGTTRGVERCAPEAWGLVLARLVPLLGDDAGLLDGVVCARWCDEVILLEVATPYLLIDLPPRIGGIIKGLAAEQTGIVVTLDWCLSPDYEHRTAAEHARARAKEEQAEREHEERSRRLSRLKELFVDRSAPALAEASMLVTSDPDLVGLLAPIVRKQLEAWLVGASSGGGYQTAKEAVYQAAKKGGGV